MKKNFLTKAHLGKINCKNVLKQIRHISKIEYSFSKLNDDKPLTFEQH